VSIISSLLIQSQAILIGSRRHSGYNDAMDTEIAHTLIRLNQQFYQTFAAPFSATRQKIQPGVRKITGQIPPLSRILDLGCGNGKLWQWLVEKGFRGEYCGLDFSVELLGTAMQQVRQTCLQQPEIPPAAFHSVDLTEPGWASGFSPSGYDFVLAFAVLHHLPGIFTVHQTLDQIRRLLAPGGKFIFSVWQFLNSARLRQRIQDWSKIGLHQDQVEAGDYLLDWRQGGQGLRYVHAFNSTDLERLAGRSGFTIIDEFLSDGKDGNLSFYQTWI